MAAGITLRSILDGLGAAFKGAFHVLDTGDLANTSSIPMFMLGDLAHNPVAFLPTAAGNGMTTKTVDSAASTNLVAVKGAAGNIYEADLFNSAAYDVIVQFFDKATAPVIGTDTPIFQIYLGTKMGWSKSFAFGKSFPTGIAYAITKADGTTAVALHDVRGYLDWI